ARSRLNWWRRGMQIPSQGKRLLIGVAPYSAADLQLLDATNEVLAQARGEPIRVDVFNVLECQSMADFDSYLPGIGPVYQTPVAGLWEEGVLRETASGRAARELIARVLAPDGLEPRSGQGS